MPASRPLSRRRIAPLVACVLMAAGCGGPITFSQRLAGAWRGRPETAAERIDREWPAASVGGGEAVSAKPDDLPDTTPTVLESLDGLAVRMQLDVNGGIEMSLDDEQPLRGEWRLVTSEGRRGIIEIEIKRADGKPAEDKSETPGERRRFRVIFVPPAEGQPERFTLAEQGADPQFGRLIFERSDEVTLTRSEL